MRAQMQGDLFSEGAGQTTSQKSYAGAIRLLLLVPVRRGGAKEQKAQDCRLGRREAYSGKCTRTRLIRLEDKFRAKLEMTSSARDLMFLMGNQHRFPDQWLIIQPVLPA